jgi:DNA-binding NtrC family response regulator
MMNKSILVVDDERSVADTLAAVLQMAGYRTTAVYSAAEALQVLQTAERTLIISDVIMPGANGVELAMQVRRLQPQAKILLVSGNAATETVVESARVMGYSFEVLAKPIPPRQMLRKVASILNDGASGAVFPSLAKAASA